MCDRVQVLWRGWGGRVATHQDHKPGKKWRLGPAHQLWPGKDCHGSLCAWTVELTDMCEGIREPAGCKEAQDECLVCVWGGGERRVSCTQT